MVHTISPWSAAVLTETASFLTAIENLNVTGLQVVLVVNSEGAFLGTLSDGDIRRSILGGRDLKAPISDAVNRNPVTVAPHVAREDAFKIMNSRRVHQLPILENGLLVGLYMWDQVADVQALPNSMVIMAGGKGIRLRPRTENCPKPMLPLHGKPILEHIVERAKKEGIVKFVFAIHYLGHMIEKHFGDGSAFGVNIEYLREETPLGTAGALSLMTSSNEHSFIVTNGDVLTDVRYSDVIKFHDAHGAAATMAVRLHQWQNPFGVVHTDGMEIIGFEEKPIHASKINAGVYVISKNALAKLTTGEHCDMPALFKRLRGSGLRTLAYPLYESWIDIGREEDYNFAINLRPM